MPITTTNLETVINDKVVAASSTTENKDLLLLSKSIEALDSSTSLKPADIGVTVQGYDSTVLRSVDNLSTLADVSISRTNLGLGTAATSASTAFESADADISKTDVAETRSASIDMADNVLQKPEIKDYSESVVVANGTTLDLEQGNVFTKSVSSNIGQLYFSNPPASGKSGAFTFICTMSGSPAITWPNTVKWAGGEDPTLSTSGVDIFTFLTTDGGAVWYGFTSGQGMS
jgi:hypothetical protein